MAHEDDVKSNSDEIITFDELGDAYIELENDFKRLRKSYSSLKKEHACCNSKIGELLKVKDEYIIKLNSYKNVVEKLEVENKSLKQKMNEFNANLATPHASTSHSHVKSYNSFTHNKNYAKKYHNHKYTQHKSMICMIVSIIDTNQMLYAHIIATCNASIPRVRRCYCDVYMQVGDILTYIR